LAGASEKANFRGTSLETLKHMVSAGNGMTLMPELATLLATDRHSQVHYLPFEAPAPSRQIGLIWRKSSPRQQCFEQLTHIITASVKPCL
jgi:LysR family hydrogen peroxide-inducible transcriptional activator